MPTDVVSKIGASNSPTTMDYTDLQSWEDACPANLVTADQRWVGECYDQGEFVSSGVLLDISGETTDATRYLILRCATGASFRDKAGVITTALTYNASNGVAIRSTGNYVTTIGASVKTLFSGLQVSGQSVNAVTFTAGDGNITRDCIIINTGASTNYTAGSSNNTYSLFFYNCLVIFNGVGGGFCVYGRSSSGGAGCVGCTSIKLGASAGANYVLDNYGTVLLKDCAGFGASAFKSGNATGATGSGYNATDKATGFGSNNQTSLTFASQFVSTTTDFRAVSTGSLYLNGTPDATNIPTDISGTSRHATTPTVGCWEAVASGSAYTLSITKASYVETGAAANLLAARTIPVIKATYAEIGVVAGLFRGFYIPVSTPAYTITGITARLLKASTLPCATSSYALTGIAAAPKASRLIQPTLATYAETGVSALLRKGFLLAPATAAYTLVGIAASLVKSRLFACATGVYALTGIAAGLRSTRLIQPAIGTYSLTGVAASPKTARLIAPAAGSYTLSGVSVSFARTRAIVGLTAQYLVGGVSSSLIKAARLPITTGSYTLTGADATLFKTLLFPCNTGAFTLTGIDVGKLVNRKIVAAVTTYVVAGSATPILASRRLPASQSSFVVTGVAASLFASRRVVGVAGSYTLTGRNAILAASRQLSSASGVFIYSGIAATLRNSANLNPRVIPALWKSRRHNLIWKPTRNVLNWRI